MWRRHKVEAGLHCTDEAQKKAETRVCSYLAPCKNSPFLEFENMNLTIGPLTLTVSHYCQVVIVNGSLSQVTEVKIGVSTTNSDVLPATAHPLFAEFWLLDTYWSQKYP